MSSILRRAINKFSYHKDRNAILEKELKKWKTSFMPPGHYYSPFPDPAELTKHKNQIFHRNAELVFPGIDLQTNAQFELLQRLSSYYRSDLFPMDKSANSRYYFNNQYFCFSDAIFLSAMMREWRPKRIIEIGSGFSSAVMLDVNEQYFNNSIQLTFVEPFPEDRLNDLVRAADNCSIIKDFVQHVPVQSFLELEENDILFIDSSHVSKTYSDVNHLIFNILPLLKKGVIVHIHDVLFPFEYPAEWMIDQQRAWNEAYLVRAFLQFNSAFRIELFTSYLEIKFRDWFLEKMPLCLEKHEQFAKEDGIVYFLETGGQSLYLRKVN